jgi:hypothetical protein
MVADRRDGANGFGIAPGAARREGHACSRADVAPPRNTAAAITAGVELAAQAKGTALATIAGRDWRRGLTMRTTDQHVHRLTGLYSFAPLDRGSHRAAGRPAGNL